MKKHKKEKHDKRAHYNEKVQWQPLSRLALIVDMVEENVRDAENQELLLMEGTANPYLFDAAVISRIKRLFKEKLAFADIYAEQAKRWKREIVDKKDEFDLMRLTERSKRFKELCQSILALADGISKQQIDTILHMDEGELALRVLMGDMKLPPVEAARKKGASKGKSLTVNERFLDELLSSEPPCIGLGLVEVSGVLCGFVALCLDKNIPPEVTESGFCFGHRIFGTKDYEIIQFSFEFYGYRTYNALLNPNNEIVRQVVSTMIESGDYFFFAINPNGSVIAFRSELGEENLAGLKQNIDRIQNSSTTESQYASVLARFAKKADPPGIILDWVCRDDASYLDLTKDRHELMPAK